MVSSRKTVRDKLVTSLKSIPELADEAVTGAPHVFGFLAKTFNGMSPCACVDTLGVQYDTIGDESDLSRFRFIVGFWVNRESASEAEDMLDKLALEFSAKIRNDYYGQFFQQSTTDYETLDGTPYKFELHFLEINY